MTTKKSKMHSLIKWVRCERSDYHGFGNSIWKGFLGDTYICEISNWSKMNQDRYNQFPIELCVFLPFLTNDEHEYREAKTVSEIKGKAERLVLRWLQKSNCTFTG